MTIRMVDEKNGETTYRVVNVNKSSLVLLGGQEVGRVTPENPFFTVPAESVIDDAQFEVRELDDGGSVHTGPGIKLPEPVIGNREHTEEPRRTNVNESIDSEVGKDTRIPELYMIVPVAPLEVNLGVRNCKDGPIDVYQVFGKEYRKTGTFVLENGEVRASILENKRPLDLCVAVDGDNYSAVANYSGN